MERKWIEGKAIYVQIMDMICSDISSRKMNPSQKMESVREYAVKYSVNPNTMQKKQQGSFARG